MRITKIINLRLFFKVQAKQVYIKRQPTKMIDTGR